MSLATEYQLEIATKAKEKGLTPEEYLDELVNNASGHLHTLTIAEMMRGYKEVGALNQEIAEEGLVDGDTSW